MIYHTAIPATLAGCISSISMEPTEQTHSFGYWLRRRRKACDLTQAQLADRAGCSRAMIRKIEADERRPSGELAVCLADALGLARIERATFLAAARAELAVDELRLPAEPLTAGAPSSATPAPPTPLRGRAADLAALLALLRDPSCRCVTLVGPGGVGKTRLALAAIEALAGANDAAIWFVPLAALDRPELLLTTVALALGLRGSAPASAQLQAWPRLRRALLVLDNLEHLVAAAGDLAALLAAVPGLRLLVTSRAPLRIAAERLIDVPPLALPPERPGLPATAADLATPAAALFLERCAMAGSLATLQPEDYSAVARIVRRLDGLPLAIELAAARTRLLMPRDLLARLDDSLDLLADGPRDLPPRQRSLRDVVRWSYQLVEPTARATFARLAVFSGGFELTAAEAVDPRPGLFERLSSLRDASLIRRDDRQPRRLAMLETIAEYARERLAESGELADARARHAAWYLTLGRAAETGLCGADRLEWIERLECELPNLRAALQWAIHEGNDPAGGMMLAGGIRQYWHVRGRHREGREWLAAGLARLAPAATLEHGRACLAAGYLSWFLREYPQAADSLTQAAELLRPTGDATLYAEALALGAMAALSAAGDVARAVALADEALSVAARHGAPWTIGMARFWRAAIAANVGDSVGAATNAAASISAFIAAGDAWNGGPHSILGDLALSAGDYRAAHTHYLSALSCFGAIGDVWGCGFSLRTLAEIALRAGRLVEARQLAGESLACWQALGDQAAARRSQRLLAEIAGPAGG